MKQEIETMKVTPEERDLIEQMRNYNNSYPNGYPVLLEKSSTPCSANLISSRTCFALNKSMGF